MPSERKTVEEVYEKFWQVHLLTSQGTKLREAIRTVGITPVTYYRWRKQYEALMDVQAGQMKVLQEENDRLCRAVSDLTLALDNLILEKAKKVNF